MGNDHLDKLHTFFKTFPGIGKRQAERFVYHILAKDSVWTQSFIKEIERVKSTTTECSDCFRIIKTTSSINGLCNVCSDGIGPEILSVVEKSSDIETLVQKGHFKSQFFVLGGQIPVIEKKVAVKVRLEGLLERIKKLESKGLKEIIVCTSYNPDGIFTATVVKDKIRENFTDKFKITTFGRGFSSGTELDYVDSDTLIHALERREQI